MRNRAYLALPIAILAWGVIWFATQSLVLRIVPAQLDPRVTTVMVLIAVVVGPGLITAGFVAARLAAEPGLGAALATGVIIALVSVIHSALLYSTNWRFSFHVFFLPQIVLAIPGTLLGGYLHAGVLRRAGKHGRHGA